MSTYTSLTSVADQLISLSNGVDNVPRQYFYNIDEDDDNDEDEDGHSKTLSKRYLDQLSDAGPKDSGLPSPCSQELIDIQDGSTPGRHRLDNYLNSLLRNYKLSRKTPKTANKGPKSHATHGTQGDPGGNFVGHRSGEILLKGGNDKKSVKQNETRKCVLCNVTFRSQKSFRNHMSSSHGNRSQIQLRNSVLKKTAKRFQVSSYAKSVDTIDKNKPTCNTELKHRETSIPLPIDDEEPKTFKKSLELEDGQCQEITRIDNDETTEDEEVYELYDGCNTSSIIGTFEQIERIEHVEPLNRLNSQSGVVLHDVIKQDSPVSMKGKKHQNPSSESLIEHTQCARTLTFKQHMDMCKTYPFEMKRQQNIHRQRIPEHNILDLENISTTTSEARLNRLLNNDHGVKENHEHSNKYQRADISTENDFLKKYLKTDTLSLFNAFINETNEHPFIIYDENLSSNEGGGGIDNKSVSSSEEMSSMSENEDSCARAKSVYQHRLDKLLDKKETGEKRSNLQYWMDKALELLDKGPSLYELVNQKCTEEESENQGDRQCTNFSIYPDKENDLEDQLDHCDRIQELNASMSMTDNDSQYNASLSRIQTDLPSFSYQRKEGICISSPLNRTEIEGASCSSGHRTEDVVEIAMDEPPEDICYSDILNDADNLSGIKSIVDVSAQVVSFEHVRLLEVEDSRLCRVTRENTALMFNEPHDFVDKGWIILDDNISDYVIYHSNDEDDNGDVDNNDENFDSGND